MATFLLAAYEIGGPARVAGYLVEAASLLTLFSTIAWIIWMIVMLRRDVVRHREGQCMRCGYDLRFATDRCPECGEAIHRTSKLVKKDGHE